MENIHLKLNLNFDWFKYYGSLKLGGNKGLNTTEYIEQTVISQDTATKEAIVQFPINDVL